MRAKPASKLLLLAAVTALATAASGCGRKKMTDAQAGIPDLGPAAGSARQAAVRDGAAAMRAFQREQVRARLEGAEPSYGPARAALAGALSRLRPGGGRPSAPGLEAVTESFEAALAAMDAILKAQASQDEAALDRGWVGFDAATESLLMALEPKPAKPTPVENR